MWKSMYGCSRIKGSVCKYLCAAGSCGSVKPAYKSKAYPCWEKQYKYGTAVSVYSSSVTLVSPASRLRCAIRSRVSASIVWIFCSNSALGGKDVQYSATKIPSRSKKSSLVIALRQRVREHTHLYSTILLPLF